MASSALEIRLSQTERELASFKESANDLQAHATRLEKKIDALHRSVFAEGTKQASTTSRAPGTPPPLPPRTKPASPLPPHAKPASAEAPIAQLPVTEPPLAGEPECHLNEEDPPAPGSPPSSTPHEEIPPPSESDREGLELEIGRVWFVRIGIGLLLTGFVFLSTYAYQNYIITWSAGSRVTLLYLAAVVLTVTGFFLERWKESLCNYGRVVAAGGWAAIYYTTYAIHHVERLRIIDNPALAAILLSLVALAFFAYAASKKSSVLTVGSLMLAFYATAINPMGWLGCFSGLLLSTIGMVFFLRFRWTQTGVTSLAGAYLSYLYWQGFINSTAASEPTRWFLVAYWLLFTVAILAPQAKRHHERLRVGFASVNNLVFFFLFSFQFHDGTWVSSLSVNALVFGSVLLVLSVVLGRTRDYSPLLRDIFLIKGLSLVTWGLTLELNGHQLFLTLMIEALALAFLWRRSRSPILRSFVWLSTGLAATLALASLLPTGELAPKLSYLILGLLLVTLAKVTRGAPFIDQSTKQFSVESLIASALALLMPTLALSLPTHAPETGLVMLGIGLALWLAHLPRRGNWPLPELVWLGQIYAALGVLTTLNTSDTLWHFGLIAALCAVMIQIHGLCYDHKRPEGFYQACRLFEFTFTALFFLAIALWIHRGVDSPTLKLLAVSAIPLAGHLYGSFLSRPGVSVLSQAFYFPTFVLSTIAANSMSSLDPPSQSSAFLAVLLVIGHLVVVHVVPKLHFRELSKECHLLAATILWTIWCIAFLDSWWLALAWTACALFFIPQRYQSKIHLHTTLALLALALAGVSLTDSSQFWLRYLVLPAAFVVHLVRSRRPQSEDHPEMNSLWNFLAFLLVVALTLILSRHTLDLFLGKGLAICWALLGLSLFGLGIGVRVRIYRLSGLALLALSLGHVLVVDVWNLDTILRILSFLTLGLVLLALGFIYNRWHEALRKLL